VVGIDNTNQNKIGKGKQNVRNSKAKCGKRRE
jgi:hypothetical protein